MGLTYSIFVKTKISFPKMKSSLEKVINFPLKRADSRDWEIYSANLLGLEICLLEATDYDDDRELKFTQYAYEIQIDYLRQTLDTSYGENWRKTAAETIANMIFKALDCECLAVKSMQELIVKFVPDV